MRARLRPAAQTQAERTAACPRANIAHLRGRLRLLIRRRDLYAFRPCFVCAKGKRDDYERGQERAAHR